MPPFLLLNATDLAAERDGRWLFRGLALGVAAGEVVRVEGANGAGKTTLLRILAGLDQDHEGVIRWPAAEQAARPWREDVLFLGHLPGLKGALTATENLAWLVAMRGKPARCALREALARVGLAGYEDVPVATLSAGQKRRVALARLHVEQAPLWLLDEPFTAIDRAGVAALEETLAAHARSGGAVLVTTHHALAVSARSLVLAPAGVAA
jgi:heme exporter protein A